MRSLTMFRIALVVLLLAVPGLGWAHPVLIVHDGTAGIEADALANLTTHLTARGFVVTANVGLPGGSISGFGQIWDIRFNNTTPLSAGDISAYVSYMAGGGSLFAMGENTGFATRNSSLIGLVQAAGGGTITLTTPLNLQTVAPPFTGPSAVSSVTYLAAAGAAFPSGTGNGRLITADAANVGAAIVWGPGQMSSAGAGALILVFDVNFLQATATAPLQALTDNMISYLAAPPAALIVHDGTAGIEADALANLTTHLTARGFVVTANVGLPGGSISGFRQIWDIRFNNTTPLSAGDIAAYVSYMAGGGSLFAMGENTGFMTRNNSLIGLVQAAGGGTIALTTPLNTETVAPPFTGPSAVSSVTYLAAAGAAFPSGTGNGRLITADAANVGAAIVWAPGQMSSAGAGALILVFDVNFLQATAAAPLQALTDNMISYLAAPVPVDGADFNGDGKPDILWRDSSTGQNVVWLMDGTTVVGQASLPTVPDPQWRIVATADLNGDRNSDLVWRNAATGQNVVWYLNGTTFVSQVSLPTVADASWQIVAVADFNGDGKPDLVWRNRTTGTNVVWYLDGATFVSQVFLPSVAATAWQIVAAADFTGDGKPDLVWRNAVTGQNVIWCLDGTTLVTQVTLPVVADTRWYVGMAADVDHDGNVDLVWRNATTGQNVVWYMSGTTFASQTMLPPAANTWSLPGVPRRVAGDFNADGNPDLLWRNVSTGQNVVWEMSGTTFLSQVVLPSVADLNWQMVATADLNGDDQTDIVWRNQFTGANVVWYMSGTTFVSQASLPPVADTAWQIVAAADFNGDGKPDLVWRNATTGQNVVWFLDGATILSQALLPSVPAVEWRIIDSADFNADGQPDLVWRNVLTGQNVFWYLNGTAVVSQGALPTVPDTAWQISMAADFNADGRPDLVWRNVATGQNVVWYLEGTTLLVQVVLPIVPDTNWKILRDRR
jgi:hypothetical protein